MNTKRDNTISVALRLLHHQLKVSDLTQTEDDTLLPLVDINALSEQFRLAQKPANLRAFCMIKDGLIRHAEDEGVDLVVFDYELMAAEASIDAIIPAGYLDLAIKAGIPEQIITESVRRFSNENDDEVDDLDSESFEDSDEVFDAFEQDRLAYEEELLYEDLNSTIDEADQSVY